MCLIVIKFLSVDFGMKWDLDLLIYLCTYLFINWVISRVSQTEIQELMES